MHKLFCSLLLVLAFLIQAIDMTATLGDVQEVRGEVKALAQEQAAIFSQAPERRISAPTLPPPLAEPPFTPDPDIPLSDELQLHTHEVGEVYGVPPEILLAIMWHESRYQVDATGYNLNGTYDSGLCQINSVNHGWLLEDHGLDIADPADNIEAAAVMIAMFMEDYTLEEALAAYAVGECGMQAGGGSWFAEEILDGAK